jgi:Ohr subfamily peroxiredoxin
MKTLYTANVQVEGGRDGQARSSDGLLNLKLGMAKELGGGGQGTNPEQLFAAGYAACYESAVRYVARQRKIEVTKSSIDSTVELKARPEGGFALAVKLNVSLPDVARDQAQGLLDAAHQVCPYSHATKGNIEVTTTLL